MSNILQAMLKENTGRALCDSGDYYGRHWQQNQGRDFESEPSATLDFKRGIEVTLNVYHWLKERVSLNEKLNAEYRKFVKKNDLYLDLNSAFDFAVKRGGSGLYGDGGPFVVNTYNHDSLLSQNIQYVYWEEDEGVYVLLQIHGGCDARGGYTDPVVFDVDESFLFDSDAVISCSKCGHRWTTDDGFHWRDGIDWGANNLEDLESVDERPAYQEVYHEGQMVFDGLPERPAVSSDVLWINEDGGHCPYCGGLLEAF